MCAVHAPGILIETVFSTGLEEQQQLTFQVQISDLFTSYSKSYYFSMLLKAQDHQISSQRELADELSAFFEQLNSLLFHGNPRCPGITSLRICTVTVAKGLYATVTPSNVFREP